MTKRLRRVIISPYGYVIAFDLLKGGLTILKDYIKPVLDIVEFQLNIDIVTESDGFEDPFGGFGFNNTDEIFIGEEEGYIV